MKQKLFTRDFALVVIGQIISLFGNAAIRFALPLYLLNQTGSSALYGTVTACAFLPAILLSPIGGIVADRVNKRNIMVALDFFTAAVILVFSRLLGGGNLVLLMTVTLMLLYGIAGAYQPSVQASIPALVCQEKLMAANSVINMISSFSSLLGPVLGGMLYSIWGLRPVLWVCMVCFFLSAVMEIFIHIPSYGPDGGCDTVPAGDSEMLCGADLVHGVGEACDAALADGSEMPCSSDPVHVVDGACNTVPAGNPEMPRGSDRYKKKRREQSLWEIVRADFTESVRFIRTGKPVIGKVMLAVCALNLFLSAMLSVGMPYLITERLAFDGAVANRLYGFAEGALAIGGLAGGICAGLLGEKLSVRRAGELLAACAALVFPIGAALALFPMDTASFLIYLILVVCCLFIMLLSNIFTIQMMSFVQAETPGNLIGKVVSVILTICMCAQPLGNAIYGILFEVCSGFEYAVVFLSGCLSLLIAFGTKKIFHGLV